MADFGFVGPSYEAEKERKKIYAREYARIRRLSDPKFVEKQREAGRKSRVKYAEERNKSTKEWKINNKEKVIEYNKNYSKENRKSITKKTCERNKIRMKTDPIFVLIKRERLRVWEALNGKRKTAKTETLLGCSYQFFKEHLEKMFLDKMGWHNMNEWHIDHIKPLASFDLSDEAQQKIAFHYTNQQPLWAIDNLRKGAKYG